MKSKLKHYLITLLLAGLLTQLSYGQTIKISRAVLKDKIKGAWAAQTIGVTFGGPVEFRYNSTMIPDYLTIPWYDGYLKETYENQPGLYDDIYMDLTFVQILEDRGLDAPAKAFADAFANADYELWFANQTARYNILNGLNPPESGYWLNNPCADDIDFQIEADFAGIMCPGLPNAAAKICDRVGHIMNYGDGWYGGVYIAAMYTLAFVSNDINYVVEEALKIIPEESNFAQCISDVIRWHRENPADWKETWFKVHRKWSQDIGSPLGVYVPFNIDAKINAAWVVMGLLYGDGDFTKTYQTAARCGDDADCNPASAGGILGVITGYEKIPTYWKQGLADVEPIAFKYTTISLNKAYDLSFNHALDMIKRNGGEVSGEEITIPVQVPQTVPLEIAFKGHYPKDRLRLEKNVTDEITFEFEGIGFAVTGSTKKLAEEEYIFDTEMYIDDKLIEKAQLPTSENHRRFTPFWRYQLPGGKHIVHIKIVNPSDKAQLRLNHVIVYGDQPIAQKF